MRRAVTVDRTIGLIALSGMFGMLSSALAQQPPAQTVAPLFLKVDWVRPESQEDTSVRYTPVQENIADPNVEIHYYGPGAKQILTTGTPGSEVRPYGVWTGTAEGPFAITFGMKTGNYVDLTGLANVRWFTKTSGFHVVRPVVRLADGTLLVGDRTFSSVPKLTLSEFSLTDIRWIKLDPERMVTVNSGRSPTNEVWAPNPDLTRVAEVGFADLHPGSGHGTGGYIQLGGIEVYGKTVPPGTRSTR